MVRKLRIENCELRIACAAVLMIGSVALAQEVGLKATSDSGSVRVADVISVTIKERLPETVVSIELARKDSAGPFEIVEASHNAAESSWKFKVMTLDSGDVYLPPIEFLYKVQGDTNARRAYSNALKFSVAGVPIDPSGSIKDIKGPVSGQWKFEDVFPYLAVLIVVGGGVAGYWYYRKKKQQRLAAFIPPKPAVAPHVEALARLRQLEDEKLWQQGKVKEYYSSITEIVRYFFERRWDIVAMELTSDEILGQMRRIPEAERVRTEMERFFTMADLTKFAKYQPTPADHENELKWAYTIVRAMVPTAKTVEEEKVQEKEMADVR